MKVIRMHSKRFYGQKFSWVHLANEAGGPLCGETYDPKKFEARHEETGDLDGVSVCIACRAVKEQFKIETLQAGQRYPYADSIYEYRITDLANVKRDRDAVLEFCQHVQKSYPCDEMAHPFLPKLRELRDTGDGVWIYHVVKQYAG